MDTGTDEANRIIERLRKEKNLQRQKQSLYLSTTLYDRIRTVCKQRGITVSRLLDSLMTRFLESLDKSDGQK